MATASGNAVTFPDHLDARSTYRTVNDVRIHAVEAGDESDPLVVLLHGFPEFWYGWHRQIQPLVEAGYRVFVPDQRGYNGTEKPKAVSSYRLSACSGDVLALIDDVGQESAHVVGHDWGGVVAWQLAIDHPGAVQSLSICNVGHPRAYLKHLLFDARQRKRSWYTAFFQLPGIPELLWRINDESFFSVTMESVALSETFSEGDKRRYIQAWNQPGARTAMLNWYRAAVRYPVIQTNPVIEPPTLVIWGEQDPAMVPEMAEGSIDYCEDGRLERFPEATHWVQHEYPEDVASLLVEHLDAH